MRQSEPPVPKIDKPIGTLPGADGAIAVVADVIPALQPGTVDSKQAV